VYTQRRVRAHLSLFGEPEVLRIDYAMSGIIFEYLNEQIRLDRFSEKNTY